MVAASRSYFDILLSKLGDPQSKFVRAIISKDFSGAKKLAYELYKEHPQYLAFYCYMHLKDHKQILLAVLKKVRHIDPQLFYCLAKSDHLSYLELEYFLSRFSGSSFIECCIRKAMLLKRYDESSRVPAQELSDVRSSSEPQVQKTELEKMISELDDFSLYDLAIKQKIELDANESINYHWYLVAREKNTDSAIRILNKSTDFCEIQELGRCLGNSLSELAKSIEPDSAHGILIRYLEQGYSKDALQLAWNNFCGESVYLNLKILLALLIASREERNLVLAFYLSQKHTYSDNYEIDLVHLFLNRYFMFHANIATMFERLEIKNIQQHNLAYIWSDPMILSSIRLSSSISLFKIEIGEQISAIDASLRKFIDSNKIACAVSLLSLRERLTNSVVFREIEGSKILCTEPRTMFSSLLGDECSYMFDKIIISDVRTETGIISSIRSMGVDSTSRDIFDNEIFPIKDKDFIDSFLKMNKDKC